MTNFAAPQGNSIQGPGKAAQRPSTAGGYQSKLDEILAKAGANNPIAAAQAKPVPGTQSQVNPKQSTTPPQPTAPAASIAPAVITPAAPAAPAANPTATRQPLTPQDKLNQILAMAGQTPAQRAQAQAQQIQANNAANIAGMLQAYFAALAVDPRKVLFCDIEFPIDPGGNDDIYFKCYADAAGNIYWDMFGMDISHLIPANISPYGLYDDYYKGIPDNIMQAELLTATIHSNQIV